MTTTIKLPHDLFPAVLFTNLKIKDCFFILNDLYMKVKEIPQYDEDGDETDEPYNAVILNKGDLQHIPSNCGVIPAKVDICSSIKQEK